ncbi:hypothetical protein [Priestia taiwanensis]|uniref:Uncharacterized protein n=1 Tax=Priestia taiwanensis TaxID=1347902 RepID=A0A917ELQ4_9BACI|nr:hypothetical protein [Priestia taiwanensis]MBM7361946.1 hypothetical protein [Priestia taiwanensis]GGE58259.1 hypothetical protein GCM10007140_05740 [Priestia taiwanensis]
MNKGIDFVLTLMPCLSVLKVDNSKSIHIFNMLKYDFPHIPIDSNTDYFQFYNVHAFFHQHVQAGFPTEELLRRIEAQGMCKLVCRRIFSVTEVDRLVFL